MSISAAGTTISNRWVACSRFWNGPPPLDEVTGGDDPGPLHGRLRFPHEPGQVTASDVHFDGDPALAAFMTDLGVTILDPDVGKLRQGDDLPARRRNREAAQLRGIPSAVGCKAHLKDETPLALEHDTGLAPSHRLDHVEDIGGVDPVARNGGTVEHHPQQRQAGGLLRLDIGRTGNPLQRLDGLHRGPFERCQIVPENRERHIRADPGNQLAHPELDRL
jgi:hypothetical protein